MSRFIVHVNVTYRRILSPALLRALDDVDTAQPDRLRKKCSTDLLEPNALVNP